LETLDLQRRFAYQKKFLERVLASGPQPEVAWNSEEVGRSVNAVSEIGLQGPKVRPNAVKLLSAVMRETDDEMIRKQCEAASRSWAPHRMPTWLPCAASPVRMWHPPDGIQESSPRRQMNRLSVRPAVFLLLAIFASIESAGAAPVRLVVIKVDGLPGSVVERCLQEVDPGDRAKSALPWIKRLFVERGAWVRNFYVRGISVSTPSWSMLDTAGTWQFAAMLSTTDTRGTYTIT